MGQKPVKAKRDRDNHSVIELVDGHHVLWGYRVKSGVKFIQVLSEKAVELYKYFESRPKNHIQKVYPFKIYTTTWGYNNMLSMFVEFAEIPEHVTSNTGRHIRITQLDGWPSYIRNTMIGHMAEGDTKMANEHYIDKQVTKAVQNQIKWLNYSPEIKKDIMEMYKEQ
jgi:hypothetical protein